MRCVYWWWGGAPAPCRQCDDAAFEAASLVAGKVLIRRVSRCAGGRRLTFCMQMGLAVSLSVACGASVSVLAVGDWRCVVRDRMPALLRCGCPGNAVAWGGLGMWR